MTMKVREPNLSKDGVQRNHSVCLNCSKLPARVTHHFSRDEALGPSTPQTPVNARWSLEALSALRDEDIVIALSDS